MPSISALFISWMQLPGSCWNIHLQGFLRQPNSSLSQLCSYICGSSAPRPPPYPDPLLFFHPDSGQMHIPFSPCTPLPITDISSPGSEILIPVTDTNSEAKHPPFPYCPFSGSPNPFSLLYYKSTPRRVIEAMENTRKDFEMAITHLPAHLCRHCGLSYPSSLHA